MSRNRKVNKNGGDKPTTQNLVELCYRSGFKGVPGVARQINRHPKTIWRAVRWPDQFAPTYRKLVETLCA
jgi:hypothetical protein